MSKTTKSSASKADLIVAIQTLLRNKMVGTQDEICAALEKQGFVVNQVKISRLLHKIGAIKMSENNRVVYRLPTELVKLPSKDSVKQFILRIGHNECLIVIQTVPGSAQVVARLLDLENSEGVLGTVAGDDTIFVTPTSIKKTNLVYQQIHKMLLD